MCTYTYVGKIPICHSFLGCLGIFDFSHRSRNPFDNFMSPAGQYNRGSFEIRLENNGFIICSVIEENNISRNKKS